MDKINLSIVVPVYKGKDFLNKLFNRIKEQKDIYINNKYPFEILELIFVDDDSQDGSHDILKKLSNKYSWVRYITHSRNFGQHSTTEMGVLHTSGNWVVTLDEDLQHPPELIITMLKLVSDTNSDIIYVNSNSSIHQNLFRDYSSKLIKKTISLLVNNRNVKFFNSFRLIRGEIARASASVCNYETYYDICLGWFTKRISVCFTDLKDRRMAKGKKSGYNLISLLSHSRKLIISSKVGLIRFLGLFSVIIMFFSIISDRKSTRLNSSH